MKSLLIFILVIIVLFLSLFYVDSQKQIKGLRFDLNRYIGETQSCNAKLIFEKAVTRELTNAQKNSETYYTNNCQCVPTGALDNPNYE